MSIYLSSLSSAHKITPSSSFYFLSLRAPAKPHHLAVQAICYTFTNKNKGFLQKKKKRERTKKLWVMPTHYNNSSMHSYIILLFYLICNPSHCIPRVQNTWLNASKHAGFGVWHRQAAQLPHYTQNPPISQSITQQIVTQNSIHRQSKFFKRGQNASNHPPASM